jgi:GDP-L-fucose synthase
MGLQHWQSVTQYLCAIQTSLYGPSDYCDLLASHVLPALIHRLHDAKKHGDETARLWGTGTPRRDGLYSGDRAVARVHVVTPQPDESATLVNDREPPSVSVGSGDNLTNREHAHLVCAIVGPDTAIELVTPKRDAYHPSCATFGS